MKALVTLIFGVMLTGGLSIDAAAQNYKIKQTTSMAGQNMTSTVYVKGSRKRTESSGMMGIGADVADIEQCDLRQNLKVNDKKRLYFLEPFATDESTESAPTRPVAPPPAANGKVVRGGTITMTSVINDTGERKQMFGLTARHIKTSMTMQSSPDACSKNDVSIETDGWYVDLPSFSCPVSVNRPQMPPTRQAKPGGCQDRMIIRSSGGGKLGFALQLTSMMKMGGGRDEGFSQSLETTEFTKAALDDALFAVPTGYTAANSQQDLYGKPDFSAMMRGDQDDDTSRPASGRPGGDTIKQNPPPGIKRAGVVRIGVLAPTNRSGENVSTTNLQGYLIQKLTVGNTDGFAVNSEADARAAGCDYILTSDLSKLKQSNASKLGGLFGKVTGTDTSATKNYDAQVDFKLVSLKSGQQVLQNKAAAKTEGAADRAAEGVLAQEAAAVLAAAR